MIFDAERNRHSFRNVFGCVRAVVQQQHNRRRRPSLLAQCCQASTDSRRFIARRYRDHQARAGTAILWGRKTCHPIFGLAGRHA